MGSICITLRLYDCHEVSTDYPMAIDTNILPRIGDEMWVDFRLYKVDNVQWNLNPMSNGAYGREVSQVIVMARSL